MWKREMSTSEVSCVGARTSSDPWWKERKEEELLRSLLGDFLLWVSTNHGERRNNKHMRAVQAEPSRPRREAHSEQNRTLVDCGPALAGNRTTCESRIV